MHSPGLFEALLVAEVAGLELHLFAGGAHHGCLLAAAWGPADEVGALHVELIIESLVIESRHKKPPSWLCCPVVEWCRIVE